MAYIRPGGAVSYTICTIRPFVLQLYIIIRFIGIIVALVVIIAIVTVTILVVAVISLKIRAAKPIQYGAKNPLEKKDP